MKKMGKGGYGSHKKSKSPGYAGGGYATGGVTRQHYKLATTGTPGQTGAKTASSEKPSTRW